MLSIPIIGQQSYSPFRLAFLVPVSCPSHSCMMLFFSCCLWHSHLEIPTSSICFQPLQASETFILLVCIQSILSFVEGNKQTLQCRGACEESMYLHHVLSADVSLVCSSSDGHTLYGVKPEAHVHRQHCVEPELISSVSWQDVLDQAYCCANCAYTASSLELAHLQLAWMVAKEARLCLQYAMQTCTDPVLESVYQQQEIIFGGRRKSLACVHV